MNNNIKRLKKIKENLQEVSDKKIIKFIDDNGNNRVMLNGDSTDDVFGNGVIKGYWMTQQEYNALTQQQLADLDIETLKLGKFYLDRIKIII